MTQTSNRFFDEIGRLMNDAAGAAQGVKREVDTVMRNQAERILRDLDLVKREEFDAVKDMARLAREENEALKAPDCGAGSQARHLAGSGSGRPGRGVTGLEAGRAGIRARSAQTQCPDCAALHPGTSGFGPQTAEKSLHFLVISPLWG